LLEYRLEDGWVQVDGDPFEQEQAGHGRLDPGRAQPVRHWVPGEVSLDERHVGRGDAEPLQPFQLVPLGRGMVHLEPADPRLGVAERAAVVAGRADHDLPHAAVDGADDSPVEERGARGEVVVYPVRRGHQTGRDVGGQGLVGGGSAVRRRDPGEAEPVRRDPAGGYRGTPVFHVWLLCHVATRDGLSLTERRVLAAVADGVPDAGTAFVRAGARETRPYMGDTTCLGRMDQMAAGPHPLLRLDPPGRPVEGTTGVRLTDTGARVLAGQADQIGLNGIDRWIGGVHLHGHQVPWRWDDGTETIIHLSRS
jgi:hypothetical protein